MTALPLVTIMIATKDRAEDLAVTLRDLRRQDYEALELIVIDDASTPPIASIVKEHWPAALVIRHDRALGQAARRNEGFRLANGKYILQLDDDCSLVEVAGLSKSVAYMEASPQCPGIAYHHFQGKEMATAVDTSPEVAGHCVSFVGAGVFLRKSSLARTAGYREFFVGYSEEAELSLQMLKLGWSLSYQPELIALHRYSPKNRYGPTAWKRWLRNSLWTIVIHSPMSRIPTEAGWKLAVAARDAWRLKRLRMYCETLLETIKGLREAWKLRAPLDSLSLRRYDALRSYEVLPFGMFDDPPTQRWASLGAWATRRRLGRIAALQAKRD